jgi:hypothetical protein
VLLLDGGHNLSLKTRGVNGRIRAVGLSLLDKWCLEGTGNNIEGTAAGLVQDVIPYVHFYGVL